jgi:hypothetical protein
MTFVSMQHIPLSTAYLCEDCHCVGNCAEHCPACASTALLCLAGVLNREQPAEAAHVCYSLMMNRENSSIAA